MVHFTLQLEAKFEEGGKSTLQLDCLIIRGPWSGSG